MAGFFGFSQLSSRKGLAGIAVDQGTFIMIVVSTLLMSGPFFWLDGPTLVAQARPVDLGYFVLAGVIHFVGGFTLMNKSISTIGAARTGSLIATTPLFATFLAAVTLKELVNLPLVLGVVIVITGVLFIRSPGSEPAQTETDGIQEGAALPNTLGIVANSSRFYDFAGESTYGLLAALSWGFTPVLIKKGLQSLPSASVGLTLAIASAGLVYAVLLGLRGRLRPLFSTLKHRPALWQVGAGALVGLGTLCRWEALALTTAAMVTTLSRASLLVTVGLGGKLLGRELEPITNRVRWGAGLIVLGAIIVVWVGRP
jgi:drug/metabolite transporter (DMT)-like permease